MNAYRRDLKRDLTNLATGLGGSVALEQTRGSHMRAIFNINGRKDLFPPVAERPPRGSQWVVSCEARSARCGKSITSFGAIPAPDNDRPRAGGELNYVN